MLALQLAALLLAAAPQKLDLVIEHGRVVDGTGGPWFRADVGIRGDRIVQMGDLQDVPAKLRIDARDHMVAPGFIDLLGQSELYVLVDPRAESKIRQGITTELTGELGTVAPVRDEILGGIGGWLALHQVKIDWKDLDGYWKRFRAARPAMNLGTLVSTGQVRAAVMGQGSEAPTPDQLLRMQVEVQKAMRQGAFGVAAALRVPTDPLPDDRGAGAARPLRCEVRRLLRHASEVRGRRRSSRRWTRHSNRPARRASGGGLAPQGRREAELGANARGGPAHRRPLAPRGSTSRPTSIRTSPAPIRSTPTCPDWAQAGGLAAMLERLRDREQRARIEKEIAARWKDPSDPERVVDRLCHLARGQAVRGQESRRRGEGAGHHPGRRTGRSGAG